MGLFSRRRRDDDPLAGVDLGLDSRDRVLAACMDVESGERLAASTWMLTVLAPDGGVRLQRPWHLVDTGSYDNEADVLRVIWVDRQRELELHVDGHRPFLQAFRERVQASVVIADDLDLGGGRTAKVVVRKDLSADTLLDQVILGRGVRMADPGVRERIAAGRLAAREQVGLV